jgi:hypothetical protein
VTMTPDDYECRRCHVAMYVPDGYDPLEEDVRFCMDCMVSELERLQAGLPKTSDGVSMVPGDSVFVYDTQTLVTVGCIQNTFGGRVMWQDDHARRLLDGCECYSSRDAWEKARTGK